MAQDTITLTLKVKQDGKGFKLVGQEADKAAKSLDNTARSARSADRNLRGAAGMSSNATKNFSKMQQGISSGLVPAYAALAANVFAVTAAFGILNRSQAIKQLNEGLMFTGRAAGQNLSIVTDNLRQITDNAISSADAMRALAVGTSAGFSEAQMEGLTQVARGASLALGRDMTDALDRLVRGAAKLEPEILDELGIIVRLDTVTQDFASTLGVTAGSLTEFERRMAFTNAIIEQGNKKFGDLSTAVDVNPFNQLAATFDDLVKQAVIFFNQFIGPIAGFLANNVPALIAAFGVLGTSVVRQMVPAFVNAGDAMADLASDTAKAAANQLAATRTFKGAPKVFDTLTSKLQDGTATSEDFDRAQKSLTLSIKKHKEQMPDFKKKHEDNAKAVEVKTAKLNAAKLALRDLTQAQQLENAATLQAAKADTLALMAAGNLREGLALLKTTIMAEFAATMANVKGKNIFIVVYQLAKTAVLQLTFSLRALGIALLTAIPMLGMIATAAMAAFEAFKHFFGEKEPAETPLIKALEEGKKRFEEYPNILSQLQNSYNNATTDLDRYLLSLKAQNGLIGQTVTQINKVMAAEATHRSMRKIAVRQEAEASRNRVKQLEKELQARGLNRAEVTKLLGMSNQAGIIGVSDRTAALRDRRDISYTQKREISKLLSELEGVVDEVMIAEDKIIAITNEKTDLSAVKGTLDALGALKISLLEIANSQSANSDEVKLANQNLEILSGLITGLEQGTTSIEEVRKAMQGLQMTVGKTVETFESLTDIASDIDALFAKRERQLNFGGKFGEEVELLDKAEKALARTIKSNVLDQAAVDALSKLGIKAQVGGDAGNVAKVVEAEKIRLNNLRLEIKGRKLLAAERKRDLDLLIQVGGAEKGLLDFKENLGKDLIALQNELTEAQKKKMETDDIEIQILQKKAQIEKTRLDIIKQQTDFNKQIAGGDTTGALTAAGSFSAFLGTEELQEQFLKLDRSAQISKIAQSFNPMVESLRKLSPDGALIATAIEGVTNLAIAFEKLNETLTKTFEGNIPKFENFKEQFSKLELEQQLGIVAAAVATVGAAFTALFATMKMATESRIKDVDKQIAAEKRIDGQSDQSKAKIEALEAKKLKLQKKAFEQDKKMKMAQVVMATSLAIMQALSNVPPPFGMPVAAMFAAMGAAQLAIISGTSFDGGGASAPSSPKEMTVGKRENRVDLARGNNVAGELAFMRGERGTGRIENFRPAFGGYKMNRAAGGFVVGEQGPEMFMPQVPGEIVPAGQRMGGTTNVNFSINAVDATGVEDLLVRQKGNIIGMIREAANEHGELFLETIDTGAYN